MVSHASEELATTITNMMDNADVLNTFVTDTILAEELKEMEMVDYHPKS